MDAKKAMRILRATNNGDCLREKDLIILNAALARPLVTAEEMAFNHLYERVVDGSYAVQWLHRIKYLTSDSHGLVYWRGIQVDFIQSPKNSSSHVLVKRVADKCKHLESLGVQPDSSYTILRWCWMENLSVNSEWLPFFALKPSVWVWENYLVIGLDLIKEVVVIKDGLPYSSTSLSEFLNEFFPNSVGLNNLGLSVVMQKLGFYLPDVGQREDQGLLYSPPESVVSYLQGLGVSKNIFKEVWDRFRSSREEIL